MRWLGDATTRQLGTGTLADPLVSIAGLRDAVLGLGLPAVSPFGTTKHWLGFSSLHGAYGLFDHEAVLAAHARGRQRAGRSAEPARPARRLRAFGRTSSGPLEMLRGGGCMPRASCAVEPAPTPKAMHLPLELTFGTGTPVRRSNTLTRRLRWVVLCLVCLGLVSGGLVFGGLVFGGLVFGGSGVGGSGVGGSGVGGCSSPRVATMRPPTPNDATGERLAAAASVLACLPNLGVAAEPIDRDADRHPEERDWLIVDSPDLGAAAIAEASEPIEWAIATAAAIDGASTVTNSREARRGNPFVGLLRAQLAEPRAPPASAPPAD